MLTTSASYACNSNGLHRATTEVKDVGPIETTIKAKLQRALAPEYLEVVNESGKHNVPEGSESHFKVTVVADVFEGKDLVSCHREVNHVLREELGNSIHALSLRTLSPVEWRKRRQTTHETPPCLGGSKNAPPRRS